MTLKRNRELFRDPSQGKIAGVCAGIADYFGMENWLVRILVVSGVLLGLHFFIVVYIACWFILDKKPNHFERATNSVKSAVYSTEDHVKKAAEFVKNEVDRSIKVKSKIWQSGEPPKQAFHDIKSKFGKLEIELRRMERYVTSPEFTVSREINRL